MLFCNACGKCLDKVVEGSTIKMKCSCGMIFDGEPEDTLIASSFVVTGEYGFDALIKLSTYDEMNMNVKLECKECHRKYLTSIVTDNGCWYKCSGCEKVYKGYEY